MSTCLVTEIHAILLNKIDSSCSDKFLMAIEQSGCEEHISKAKPQVVMRWLTSFWVNASKGLIVIPPSDLESLNNAKSYQLWLKAFESTFLKTIRDNCLPKAIPAMPAFYTFE